MMQLTLTHKLLAMLVLAAVAPGLLLAQANVAPVEALSTPAPVVASPVIATSATFGPHVVQVGVTRALVTTEPTLNLQGGTAGGRNVALMLIGGATLVVGSLVGGDAGTIIMITGGVIGLTGLWRYLQYQ